VGFSIRWRWREGSTSDVAVTGYILGIVKACFGFLTVRVLMFSFNLRRRWAGRDRRKYYWDGDLGRELRDKRSFSLEGRKEAGK